MQAELGSPWYRDENPETIELTVSIENVGSLSHEIPVPFLAQEFDTDEQRRKIIERNLRDLALTLSVEWREMQ